MKVINQWLEERNSRIHGRGVFARKDIPTGTKIIEYVGEKITKAEAEIRADKQIELAEGNKDTGAVYIFELDKKFDIDGNVDWNPARLINHSCEPNCETEDDSGRIWIESIRDIKKGEEITYNYGYDLENWKEHPCKCRAKNCVGFIVAEKYWKKLGKLKVS